jgi:hypothetical protein
MQSDEDQKKCCGKYQQSAAVKSKIVLLCCGNGKTASRQHCTTAKPYWEITIPLKV